MILSSVFPVGKWRVALFVALSIVGLLGMVACTDDKTRRTILPLDDPDIQLGHESKDLDQKTAVRLVQQCVTREGGKVMVELPYSESVTRKRTCYEESFGCYEDPLSLTGFSRDVKVREQRCCRRVWKKIPKKASWEAVYQESSGEWDVSAEFSLKDVKQLIKWTVDDDTEDVAIVNDK